MQQRKNCCDLLEVWVSRFIFDKLAGPDQICLTKIVQFFQKCKLGPRMQSASASCVQVTSEFWRFCPDTAYVILWPLLPESGYS